MDIFVLTRAEMEKLVMSGVMLERLRNDPLAVMALGEPPAIEESCANVVKGFLKDSDYEVLCPICFGDKVHQLYSNCCFCEDCNMAFVIADDGDYIYGTHREPGAQDV